jgi:hypothetical protein
MQAIPNPSLDVTRSIPQGEPITFNGMNGFKTNAGSEILLGAALQPYSVSLQEPWWLAVMAVGLYWIATSTSCFQAAALLYMSTMASLALFSCLLRLD